MVFVLCAQRQLDESTTSQLTSKYFWTMTVQNRGELGIMLKAIISRIGNTQKACISRGKITPSYTPPTSPSVKPPSAPLQKLLQFPHWPHPSPQKPTKPKWNYVPLNPQGPSKLRKEEEEMNRPSAVLPIVIQTLQQLHAVLTTIIK